MTDRQLRALAVVVWVGAALGMPVGAEFAGPARGGALIALAGAWLVRSTPAVFFGAWLLAAAGAVAGAAPAEINVHAVSGPADQPVTADLVSDPAPDRGTIRVDAVIDGVRYDLRAWGSAAGHLRRRLMGERVELHARLRGVEDPPTWLLARGVRGRGTIEQVVAFTEGAAHTRLANSVRRTIESGARSLGYDRQALFAGLVYGDDRYHSPVDVDDFAGSGLTHLVAVSGSNVAFTLALAGPLLRRLGHRSRFVAIVVILALFATLTRFEPSVVRASVMTGVAASSTMLGVGASPRRVLALAVTGLVLFDPFVVHRMGFQLSVAASAGIVEWSGRVARAIPGPRPIVDAIAVTAAAQVAVAPLLLWRFGDVPVASLPANVLVAPVAGPVMMWGMTAGWVAGLVPASAAAVLHWPTRWALWWIETVAAVASRAPAGSVGAVHLVVIVGAAWWGLRQTGRFPRGVAAVIVGVALVSPAVTLAVAAPTSFATAGVIVLRDADTTVVVLDRSGSHDDVLAALRQGGVGRIDLLVAADTSYRTAELVGWLRDRHQIEAVWAPELRLGFGEVVPDLDGSAIVTVDGRHLQAAMIDGSLTLVPS